jgi:hypothetical protein
MRAPNGLETPSSVVAPIKDRGDKNVPSIAQILGATERTPEKAGILHCSKFFDAMRSNGIVTRGCMIGVRQ